MNTELPSNLAEIFPLRLVLQQDLNYQFGDDYAIAERIVDGQQFTLRPWQYEMMCRFDGSATYEEIAREVHRQFPNGFTAVGLVNFYEWLFQEDLVSCECSSLFELAEGVAVSDASFETSGSVPTALEPEVEEPVEAFSEGFATWRSRLKLIPAHENLIKISAAVIFSLAVLRIAYVTAPILEPPVDRLYSEVEDYFYGEAESVAAATRTIPEPPIVEMDLGSRAIPEPPAIEAPQLPAPTVSVSPLPAEEPPAAEISSSPEYLQSLRADLAACQIRRDEFYIQNNEEGYRREVAKMTELAKEIGRIEANP